MKVRKLAALAGLALTLTAGAAMAAEPFYETKPAFSQCSDHSYEQATKDGLTLGISPSPPYSYLDANSNTAGGIDVEINNAALKWMGITKVNYLLMPFGQLIPAVLSKRIDVIAANIHITDERAKVISFTGPAWWYGPAILLAKGNPKHITSFESLKSVNVGIVAGSASENRLKAYGVTPSTLFQTDGEEFASISQGRVDAVVDDDIKINGYLKANPNVPLEMIQAPLPGGLDIAQGGEGYARYGLRKEDCTLRAAYTQALAEMWGSGELLNILKRNGLSLHNLIFYY